MNNQIFKNFQPEEGWNRGASRKIEIPRKFRKPWKNIVKTVEKATKEREKKRESKTKGRIQNRKDGGSERVDGFCLFARFAGTQCVILLILLLYVSNFTFQPRLESISRNQSTFIDVSRFGRRYSFVT